MIYNKYKYAEHRFYRCTCRRTDLDTKHDTLEVMKKSLLKLCRKASRQLRLDLHAEALKLE